MSLALHLLKLHAAMPGMPDSDHPPPERRIRRNPQRETWNVVGTDLAGSRLYCGVWRCDPAHWRIEMAPGEHGLFTVPGGRCRAARKRSTPRGASSTRRPQHTPYRHTGATV